MNEISTPEIGGFTLLEVMVSLSILAIVMVSVFKMHSQTIFMAETAKFYSTAPMLAYQKLSGIDAFSNQELIKKENSGRFKEPFSEYRWSIFVEKANFDIQGEWSELDKDLKKIDIKISLNDDEQTYYLSAYRFLRP